MEFIELQHVRPSAADAPAESQTASSSLPPRAAHAYDTANGGVRGWLRVFGCFFVFMNTGGVAAGFGAYQAYYQIEKLADKSPSSIAWIGTTQVFLWGFTGVIAGPLYDRGLIRILIGVGGFLVVFGQFMLSVADEYWQILLAQGFCIGLGGGIMFVPAISLVTNTFTTRRTIAHGLAASGSATGGIVLPIMFTKLVPIVGFDWLNRIFGIMFFVTCSLAFVLLRPDPNHTPRQDSFFDASALKEPSYLFLCIGLFLIELGYWIPPFMIVPYAHITLHASADFAFYLLAMMNAGGLVGRILPAYISRIKGFGPARMLVTSALALSVVVFSWLGIHNIGGLIAWGILVGFLSGGPVTLPNSIVPRLSPLASVIGARTGMLWMFVSFATLIGAPIAGALIDTSKEDYSRGQIFSGVTLSVGALLLVIPALDVARKRDD